MLTRTQGDQTDHPQINPNLIRRFRKLFNLNIYQQRNHPPTRRRELHRHGRRLCTFGQFSTPPNRQWFNRFSQVNLTAFELKCRLSELCTTAIVFLFKVGIFRPSFKESAEGFLQMAQSLLQRDTAHFIEELKFVFFFPKSEQNLSAK